ncbi:MULTISPECIES: HNH endonuclease signature motif containing protein [unclassified Variovorax]|uniref:HNH endonuclease signature motif containing protein n=1 Tax=unclassified Variovorax TaxID=663243 RepID=UPI002576A52D|nr:MULTISPECIES: HNH endonuclease signature motif containing protein [unclassified Variovorax]MDM0086898.1 HNH endonuclease signature motif containing protein [Variovorax sp. J22G40]MDM0144846.1 HNH endonuclease signature motif containing protein [Variovorax sp. J2P1-31]
MSKQTHIPGQPFTAEQLRAVVSYCPETGVFTSHLTGRPIGFLVKAKGYVCLGVLGKKCNAHHLAWLLAYGEWPKGEIDHRDGVKTNNRLANLRDVSRDVNSQNQLRAHSRSTSGLLGVSADPKRGKWKASIFRESRKHFLGRFDTPELAHACYVQEKRRLHPGCTI